MQNAFVPIFLLLVCTIGLAIALLLASRLLNLRRAGQVTRMPYESGMDPIHDTRRRFDVRFHLLAIAFLIFDVELLFLYPWAVIVGNGGRGAGDEGHVRCVAGGDHVQKATLISNPQSLSPNPSPHVPRTYFFPAMTFLLLLVVGYVYLWRKGVFRWG